jgi:Tfp pilus assembly protein PilF
VARTTKQPDEALSYYRVAVALRPDAAAAHFNLGNTLLYDKKDVGGAVAEYRAAIECDPTFAYAHSNLGNALRARRDLDGAVAAYRRAIELAPRDAISHNNLGNALYDNKDLAGALAAYRTAIDCDRSLAVAHYNVGNVLRDQRDLDGAVAAYRRAIDYDPKYADAYTNLGGALRARKDVDGAIAAYCRAIELNPTSATTHGALGQALFQQGRFAEARTAARRCLELLPEGDPLRPQASQQLQVCERLLALEERLSATLRGEVEPAGAAERLALARLCQRFGPRHATAARLYAEAFAADPKLAADLGQQHRYNAACSAALAAGQGEDARHLPDKARLGLRQQALGWLRDDLALYAKLAGAAEPAGRQLVRERMQHWLGDADFAAVRDPQALDMLPDDERRPWRQLWDNVAALLQKVEGKK